MRSQWVYAHMLTSEPEQKWIVGCTILSLMITGCELLMSQMSMPTVSCSAAGNVPKILKQSEKKDGVTGSCAMGSLLSARGVGRLLRPITAHQVTIVEDVNVDLRNMHTKYNNDNCAWV